jgi:hypothetical protein
MITFAKKSQTWSISHVEKVRRYRRSTSIKAFLPELQNHALKLLTMAISSSGNT